MKREYEFDFLVNHDVIDISEHTGKSADELEKLSSSEIKDLYVSMSGELNSGEIKVNSEYYEEPKYCCLEDNGDMISATFEAHLTVTAEGKDEAECDENARMAYHGADLGDYYFNPAYEYNCTSREIKTNVITKETTDKQINPKDVMNKIWDFKKEMEEITASKLQANKEKEEIVNDIFDKKITEDIKEIYPVIHALAIEVGYDAVILRRANRPSEDSSYWSIDFKQKDEIIGGERNGRTLLVILPIDVADINPSTAIYADRATITIPDALKTENVAMKWQNAREDILRVVAEKIDAVLNNERNTLDKIKEENKNLKKNVLKDTIERN